MRKINQFEFYQLGEAFAVVKAVEHDDENWIIAVDAAQSWIDRLLNNEIVPLDVSRNAAERLKTMTQRCLNLYAEDPQKPAILKIRLSGVKSALKYFETIFSEELATIDSYLVSTIGIYSTNDLINRAERAIEERIRNVMPERAIKDFSEAGKCLAFEVSTAAGYHVMRATEEMLREWHVLRIPSVKREMEWGPTIASLTKHNADQNTLGILDQIRKFHRNPLMHPEIFLTESEAHQLFDIAKSAITAIGEQIIQLKGTQAGPNP